MGRIGIGLRSGKYSKQRAHDRNGPSGSWTGAGNVASRAQHLPLGVAEMVVPIEIRTTLTESSIQMLFAGTPYACSGPQVCGSVHKVACMIMQ